MAFEQKEDTGKILIYAMVAEVPILVGGLYQYMVTQNALWLAGAAALGAVVFIIPAILRVKRIQERDNASR
jgi:hypothetical protein